MYWNDRADFKMS